MREYAFLRTNGAMYRVFGRHHPADRVLLLLRYYRLDGTWRKPKVFSAEVISGDVLDLYDLPLLSVQHYGITLGDGASNPGSYVEYFDPLAASGSAAVRDIVVAASLPGGTVGATGSRLVGLAQPGSDRDVVVYSLDGPAVGAEILRTTSLSHEAAAAMSSTLQRIRALNRIPVPREHERNIFKGAVRDGPAVRKLDLHYALPGDDLTRDALPVSRRVGERHVHRMTVIESGSRHLFPAHVIGRAADGRECPIWINDHVLSLLLPGDQFSALCTEVIVEPYDAVQYVARTITEVTLR